MNKSSAQKRCKNTHAIVLAAGLSRRFKTGNKLLHPYKNKPLLLHCVDTLFASAIKQIIVVTGFNSGSITTTVSRRYSSARIRVVNNTEYAQGMASSIKLGINSIPEAENCLICLADMPNVKSDTVNRLIHVANTENSVFAVVPAYKGIHGNPVLFKPKSYPSLLRLEGDTGARALIKNQKQEIISIDLDDPGILEDCDTESDFHQAFTGPQQSC